VRLGFGTWCWCWGSDSKASRLGCFFYPSFFPFFGYYPPSTSSCLYKAFFLSIFPTIPALMTHEHIVICVVVPHGITFLHNTLNVL
jgi:hypothetical protein